MSDDTERSVASAGSQPVAWMTVIPLWHGGGPAVDRVFLCEREALEAKEWRDASTERGADIVPLYRSLTLIPGLNVHGPQLSIDLILLDLALQFGLLELQFLLLHLEDYGQEQSGYWSKAPPPSLPPAP